MNQLEQKVAVSGIKFLIQKFKSKSPKGWAMLTRIGIGLAAVCGAIVLAAQSGMLSFLPTHTYNNMLIVVNGIGGFLTAVGIVAKFTTTDPALIGDELKQAILNQAAQDGKIQIVDSAKPIGPTQDGGTLN